MCAIRAVSALHVVTLLGPQTLEQTLPQKLKSLESLPAAVRAAGRKARQRLVRARGVRSSKRALRPEDPGELSWSCLGHLIRETQFVHVYRRLFFMKMVWSVPVDEFWAEARGHGSRAIRLLPLLEAFAHVPVHPSIAIDPANRVNFF